MSDADDSEIEGFLSGHKPFENPPICPCGTCVGDWKILAFLGPIPLEVGLCSAQYIYFVHRLHESFSYLQPCKLEHTRHPSEPASSPMRRDGVITCFQAAGGLSRVVTIRGVGAAPFTVPTRDVRTASLFLN